jgi:hypothetical protein
MSESPAGSGSYGGPRMLDRWTKSETWDLSRVPRRGHIYGPATNRQLRRGELLKLRMSKARWLLAGSSAFTVDEVAFLCARSWPRLSGGQDIEITCSGGSFGALPRLGAHLEGRFWSEWMPDLVPRGPGTQRISRFAGGKPCELLETREYGEALQSTFKPKRSAETAAGWMSVLEDATKFTLRPLILEEDGVSLAVPTKRQPLSTRPTETLSQTGPARTGRRFSSARHRYRWRACLTLVVANADAGWRWRSVCCWGGVVVGASSSSFCELRERQRQGRAAARDRAGQAHIDQSHWGLFRRRCRSGPSAGRRVARRRGRSRRASARARSRTRCSE